MCCSEWSNGFQYQVFDTTPDTEFKWHPVTWLAMFDSALDVDPHVARRLHGGTHRPTAVQSRRGRDTSYSVLTVYQLGWLRTGILILQKWIPDSDGSGRGSDSGGFGRIPKWDQPTQCTSASPTTKARYHQTVCSKCAH